jgi:hypothetical protein
MRSTTYKKQGALDRWSLIKKKTYAFYTRNTTYKKQGAPDRRSLTQKKTYIFYTCSTAYKKQGTLDRRPLIYQKKKSMLFTRVASRRKSKRLPIGAPHILYCFQHALCRIHKVRDSVGMCSRFIILLIKFSEVFASQLVSSSLCIIQTISHQIPIDGSIYLSYTTIINI